MRLTLLASVTLALCVGIGSASAQQQDELRRRGDRACGADSRRMCKAFFGNDMAVLGCLQQNKAKLSGSCVKFLTGIGQLN